MKYVNIIQLFGITFTIGLALSCSQYDPLSLRGKHSGDHETTEGVALAQVNASYMNAATLKAYSKLFYAIDQNKVILGQQRATLTGIGPQGTSPFGDGQYAFNSDLKQMSGQHPGVMGIDVWDLAMKNPTWNQPAYSRAIRDFYANGNGGLVTLEWHMRGCDTLPVRDANGNVGIPGEGFMLKSTSDSQRSCLCRIVNEEPWKDGKSWLDWLYEEKLDKMAAKINSEQLTEIPLIFRPFHEQSGSWFWWGSMSWNCDSLLGRPNVVKGPEAFKSLFRKTVTYLRDKKGLRNLIYAFSPDKLHYAPWIAQYGSADSSAMTVDQLKGAFGHAYPGDDFVDIVGLDLYYPETTASGTQTFSYQTELFRKNLRALTLFAIEHGKVSALTETGNYGLFNEEKQADNQFFTKYLGDLLFNDPQIKLAYALFWENRVVGKTQYYLPFQGHGQFGDFAKFLAHTSLLRYDQIKGLTQATVPEPASAIYPVCGSSSVDPDGDGWGWENNQSCRVVPQVLKVYPNCGPDAKDPDGDNWSTENNQACRIVTTVPKVYPVCGPAATDPDGDGWGWDKDHTCVVRKAESQDYPVCASAISDPDGDGWGWENNKSCRIVKSQTQAFPACASSASDTDGDGWGWENNQSCRVLKREEYPICQFPNLDQDGDGWGWENNRSCRVR